MVTTPFELDPRVTLLEGAINPADCNALRGDGTRCAGVGEANNGDLMNPWPLGLPMILLAPFEAALTPLLLGIEELLLSSNEEASERLYCSAVGATPLMIAAATDDENAKVSSSELVAKVRLWGVGGASIS